MALESYCASCTYLGERANYDGKYYCSRRGDVYASDPKCYSYCEAYSRGTSARENMYNNSRGHQGGGCYLTTAMCNILNYPDDNYYLQTLRMFRDNTLKKNVNYIPLLLVYDMVGPTIAYNLQNDDKKEEIANSLFKEYIQQAVISIENNKVQDAINIYTAMTCSLAKRYDIDLSILYIDPSSICQDEIDTNVLGHGRILSKNS